MRRRWVRRLTKAAAYGAVALAALAAVGITLTVGWRPIVGAKARSVDPARRFEPTPARLARGKYLVNGVVGCYDCHSQTDSAGGGAPALKSKPGAGRVFIDEGGLRVVAPNITPDERTGIGRMSDDALARAVREGIGHDGRALFPAMPYAFYRSLSDEDLASIIAYLRAAEPAASSLPENRIPFPLSRLIHSMPEPLHAPVPAPDAPDAAARGRYLATVGGCAECHTPTKMGRPVAGLEMAGGSTLQGGERAAASNLTPDDSGISYYDEKLFLDAMRTGHVRARKLSNVMPWYVYRNMTDEDLRSVYAYLRTLRPVRHRVDNTEPPTACKVCGNRHGLGDRN
jgi:mono/diheme cytochrome c family protein